MPSSGVKSDTTEIRHSGQIFAAYPPADLLFTWLLRCHLSGAGALQERRTVRFEDRGVEHCSIAFKEYRSTIKPSHVLLLPAACQRHFFEVEAIASQGFQHVSHRMAGTAILALAFSFLKLIY